LYPSLKKGFDGLCSQYPLSTLVFSPKITTRKNRLKKEINLQ
jgi:hypothetical protein